MPKLERKLKALANPVMTPSMRRVSIAARDELIGLGARARHRVRPDRLGPTALIIGAQKAGTTFLHHQLAMHPSVRLPLTKELHFFDDRFARGMGWYLGHFPRGQQSGEITLESSPGYLVHPHAVRRIVERLPDVKLIVLLRDPTQRAYSHFLHERRLGYEPEKSFARALDLEAGRVDGEMKRMTDDPTYVSFAARHYSYVRRGEYLGQLQRCHELVGVERVLILRAEQLFRDPRRAIERTVGFLGLPDWQPTRLAANDMKYLGDPIIDEASRRRLDEHFAPFERDLERYLDRVRANV